MRMAPENVTWRNRARCLLRLAMDVVLLRHGTRIMRHKSRWIIFGVVPFDGRGLASSTQASNRSLSDAAVEFFARRDLHEKAMANRTEEQIATDEKLAAEIRQPTSHYYKTIRP